MSMSSPSDDDDRSDRFTIDPSGVVVTQCVSCAHYVARDGYAYCRPFPGGIPFAILQNRFDHRRPHPDENEPVRFTPREGVPPAVLARLAARLDEVPPSRGDG